MAKTDNVQSYTEAVHTVWADVSGADLVAMTGRHFRPARITVKYDWRTQLSDKEWSVRSLVLSGPWVLPDGMTSTETGSGSAQIFLSNAAEWARDFAAANVPRMALVDK
ncbi:hypothetical protein [Actinoplanes sp. NPDC049265]|uniref:hypothetical protein n=1 Tax=Actinoplanes sp. NPDC049265 TaxID=3363902 RepID=UPI003710D53B